MKHINFNYLMDIRAISRSSGTHQGAQMRNNLILLRFGLLTSHDRFGFSGHFGRSEHSIHSHHSRISRSIPLMFALLALAILSGGFLFSHSAYGASYVNVSSSAPEGLVKFSKVQPSSSGEMSTAEDTLTVNTNCTVGYSVYVSAINGGDTNLTNDSASGNNTISASSATVGGTSTVLSPNTWGINGSSSDVSENKYFGLPAYADATNNPLVTKSNVETSSTVPIYYGAKVTTAIAPGTYSGDVLYTVLPNTACNYYTIAYNANGGSGEMNNQAVNVGETTTLSENTFTRSGYTFLGWSNSANGKTGTATNGVGTMADVDYTNKQEVTDISDFNTTKNLYAIWAVLAGDMQTWTGCPALASGATVYLRDARDDTVYAVKKLADGKCWMIQNLTIGSKGGATLSASNTNMQAGTTSTGTAPDASGNYYLSPAGKQGAIDSSSTITSNTDVDFSTTDDNQARVVYKDEGTTDNQTGNPVPENTSYYNFYTATLGFSYYGGSYSSSSTRDICPKGWRLPKTTDTRSKVTVDSTNDLTYLAQRYNADASWSGTATTNDYYTSDSTICNNMISGDAGSIDRFGNNGAAGFAYVGYYESAMLKSVGVNGLYWSSSLYTTTASYGLYFNTTNVHPQTIRNKSHGYAVRCIAQNNYTVSYNANGGTGAASKASDTIYETGEVTTAGQGTLAKDGYNFLGWSLDANATTATYNANTAVSVPDLITAAGSPASGSTVTLYAVWEEQTDGDMQSWTNCGALSANQEVKLRDTRDNKVYAVKKLPDGKCWMVQNLTLGDSNSTAAQRTLTSANTNVSSGTYYLPPAGKQGSITSSSTLTSTTAANFTTSNDNQAKTQFRTKNTSYTNDSDTGYYNFYTATLGFSYYNDGKTSGSSSNDICPKGWRLPKTTDNGTTVSTTGTANDFTYLTRQYSTADWSGTATNYDYRTTNSTAHQGIHTGAAANGNEYAGFSYSGGWDGTHTSASNVGSLGYYWSSSVYNTGSGYRLYFDSSNVYPQLYNDKYNGYAVRCLAKDTMQETSASSLPENATTSLVDSRDGQSYTVYRWPSTGTAGTDYPTNMAGYAIMTKDLSLGYVTGGSVTKGANLTLTTSDSAAAATITARTSTSDWSTTNNDDNKQYINGTNATYGAHSYYSYGAAQAVCPKGWRPPTDAEYDYIRSFMGGNSSAGSAKIRGTPYNYVYGGYFYSSGWSTVGSIGGYWSSTQRSSTRGYSLYFDSSGLTTLSYDKYLGFSVRCVSS